MLSTTDAFFKNNQDANQLARISYLFTNPHISSLDASAAQQNKEDLKNIGKFFSYLITSIIDLRGDQIKAPSKLMPHDIQDDRWRSTMLLIIIEQNSKKYHKHSIFKLLWKYHFTTSKAQRFKHLKNTRQSRMSICVKIQMRLFGVIFKHFDNKEDA